jgi:hypothetical protein
VGGAPPPPPPPLPQHTRAVLTGYAWASGGGTLGVLICVLRPPVLRGARRCGRGHRSIRHSGDRMRAARQRWCADARARGERRRAQVVRVLAVNEGAIVGGANMAALAAAVPHARLDAMEETVEVRPRP